MGCEFESVQHENVSVLKVAGNLDTSTSKLLKEALTELVKEEQYNIVVDMRKVIQVNYMGVGTLLERLRQVRRFSGDLKLSGLNRMTRKALSMVGAHKVFETYDSEADAIASFVDEKEDVKAVIAHV